MEWAPGFFPCVGEESPKIEPVKASLGKLPSANLATSRTSPICNQRRTAEPPSFCAYWLLLVIPLSFFLWWLKDWAKVLPQMKRLGGNQKMRQNLKYSNHNNWKDILGTSTLVKASNKHPYQITNELQNRLSHWAFALQPKFLAKPTAHGNGTRVALLSLANGGIPIVLEAQSPVRSSLEVSKVGMRAQERSKNNEVLQWYDMSDLSTLIKMHLLHRQHHHKHHHTQHPAPMHQTWYDTILGKKRSWSIHIEHIK